MEKRHRHPADLDSHWNHCVANSVPLFQSARFGLYALVHGFDNSSLLDSAWDNEKAVTESPPNSDHSDDTDHSRTDDHARDKTARERPDDLEGHLLFHYREHRVLLHAGRWHNPDSRHTGKNS